MTNEVNGFSQLLEEMRAHAKLSVAEPQTQPFTPSTPALQSLLATLQNTRNRSNFNTDDVINQLKNSVKQRAMSVVHNVQSRVTTATEGYQQSGNHNEFTYSMEGILNYTQQAISALTDGVFNQAKALEGQHPDAQQAIVQFLNRAKSFVQGLFPQLKGFILHAVTDSAWLSHAEQNIHGFFADLTIWISSHIQVMD
jgi:hypothetical protein